jgi:hypothetical protein
MTRIVTSGWRGTPVHLDPYEFRHVGRLIVVRCPRAYDEVMSNVGGEWDPHHWRWLLHAPAKRRRPEGGLMNRRLTTMMQILASALWGPDPHRHIRLSLQAPAASKKGCGLSLCLRVAGQVSLPATTPRPALRSLCPRVSEATARGHCGSVAPTLIPGARVPGGVPAVVFRLKEWPDGRLRRLAELWPDPTWTIQAMARELGVGDEAVLRRAKELGLRGRPGSVRDPWPNEWSATE